MAEARRNRSNRPPRATTPKADAPLTGAIDVDDETAAALAMFNSRLVKQAEDDRAAKRVERAERAKDAAAAKVRELENDTKATVEQRTEAAAAYRQAVEALDRARKGEPEPSTKGEGESPGGDGEAPSGDASDEAPGDTEGDPVVQTGDDVEGDDTTEAAASSDR